MYPESEGGFMMKPPAGARIVVGMSGGVDSAVAAALLKEQGYDVIGVMLRLWSDSETENRCCAPDAQLEARRIAAQLEIPFYVMDAQDAFFKAVVQPFVDGYAGGVTPNPCLNCNRQIRWKYLLSRATSLGAEYIATGHYARIQQSDDGKFELLKNQDPDKDQSYFLHVLTQDDLSRTLFPLAEYSKPEVRDFARDFGLAVAERPDSQDLCFVGYGNYRDFLRKIDPSMAKPGPIIDLDGNIRGEHHGLADYTIGQRKGVGIAGPEPYYVIKKDLGQNALIIGNKSKLGRSVFYVDEINWINGEDPPAVVEAVIRIRYKSRAVPGRISPMNNDKAKIELLEPMPDITPGQAAVFYQDKICLGGGIIRREGL
jgi:tRNA-specific 2-thiouridylase